MAAPERVIARSRPRIFETAVLVVADLLVLLAVAAVYRPLLALGMFAAAAATWKLRGLYGHRIALSALDDAPSLTLGIVIGLAPVATLGVAADRLSGRATLLTGAALLLGAVTARSLAYAVILRQRARGRISYPTVMIGAGPSASGLIQRIREHPESGLHLVGTLASRTSRTPGTLPVLGTSKDLARLVNERAVTDVIIGYGGMSSGELVDVLRTCDRSDIEIYVVPRLFELHTLHCTDDHIWGLPLMRIRRPAQLELTWRMKRACDVALAAMALLLASPVLLAVALAVRLELGPGVIFRQTRIGLGGQPFELMKFRSVRLSSGDAAGPWALSPDQIGPVGRFIRRYSLDELPQLVNVVRGDMSLVGPRPERPEYVAQFSVEVPRYVHRHRVPAGMTGLAAVNGLRGDTSIEDRAHFDNCYIDSWSLWLDIKIMVRTLTAVLRGGGA